MKKVKVYKCPVCKSPYKTLNGWASHMETHHPGEIPAGMTPAQYFYALQTGKYSGHCIVCGNPTKWNEKTLKYARFCTNPKCKAEYRELFKSRMINVHGKVTLLNDPDMQRKMVHNRKISGTYTFEDGGKIEYVGSYEKDFLYMLDKFLHFPSSDVMGPSPHTYYYDYKNMDDKDNEGRKFYIPDFFIPSLNLEIEIKENSNHHPKILAVDKVKEKLKDDLMKSIPNVNYVKLVEKDYSPLFDFILKMKEYYEPAIESDLMMPDDMSIAEEGLFLTTLSNKRFLNERIPIVSLKWVTDFLDRLVKYNAGVSKKKEDMMYYLTTISTIDYKKQEVIIDIFAGGSPKDKYGSDCAVRGNGTKTKDGRPIYMMLLFQDFFKSKKELQVFGFLHEMGHILLLHLDPKSNPKGLLKNFLSRTSYQKRGKVHPFEEMADWFAMINGSSSRPLLELVEASRKYVNLGDSEVARRFAILNDKEWKLAAESLTESDEIAEEGIFSPRLKKIMLKK